MRETKKCDDLRNRMRSKVVTAAAVSTLAATGLTHGAVLLPAIGPNVPIGSVSYLGPIPTGPDTVAAGSFDIAVVGYDVTGNSSGGLVANDAAYLVGPLVPTFGTTLTKTSATIDGETATVTSTETVSKGNTVDKVTLSVPTRFIPIGSTFTDGDIIDEEDLEIGFDAGSIPLTFSVPITGTITATGTATYRTSTKKATTYTFSGASAPYTYLDPTDTMLSADEGLETLGVTNNSGYYVYTAADLTKYNLSSFSFTFTYPTPAVPEPATGMMGMAIGAGVLLRRRSRGEASPFVPLSTGLLDDPMPMPGDMPDASPQDTGQSGGEMRSFGEERLI